MKLFISGLNGFFLFSFSLIFITSKAYSQDVIPNADLEQWTGGEPDSWNTSNMTILFTQFTTVTRQTNNPQHGISSAQLQTVTHYVFPLDTVSIPGILTLGELNIDYIAQTASITGGTPFTGIPQALTGFYRYEPTTLDSCYLGFGLFRWNNGTRDTIGYAYITKGGTTPDWTSFEVPLNYDIWEAPDTMNVLFLASNVLDGLPHGGTKLWVDNLSLVYGTVSIEGISFPSDLRIYADGTRHFLIIHPALKQPEIVDMRIYNIGGQLLIYKSCSMQDSEMYLKIGELAPGTYIFRANIPGEKPFTRKFTILN